MLRHQNIYLQSNEDYLAVFNFPLPLDYGVLVSEVLWLNGSRGFRMMLVFKSCPVGQRIDVSVWGDKHGLPGSCHTKQWHPGNWPHNRVLIWLLEGQIFFGGTRKGSGFNHSSFKVEDSDDGSRLIHHTYSYLIQSEQNFKGDHWSILRNLSLLMKYTC